MNKMLEKLNQSFENKELNIPKCQGIANQRTIQKVKLPKKFQSIDFVKDYFGNLYPSSLWKTEISASLAWNPLAEGRTKPDFLLTSLDSRKRSSHSKPLFHITRSVCGVQKRINTEPPGQKFPAEPTLYRYSYQSRAKIPRHKLKQNERFIAGIIPSNSVDSGNDVKVERMLPACDTQTMTTVQSPHRYLPRKKKVNVSFNDGAVYSASERPRMSTDTNFKDQDFERLFKNVKNNSDDVYTEISRLNKHSGKLFSLPRLVNTTKSSKVENKS